MKGKIVLITGATSGIGRDTALECAKLGATVIATGRRTSLGEQLVQEIETLGASGKFLTMDVSKEADVMAGMKYIQDTWGHVDYAFLNAGAWGDPKPVVEETSNNIDMVIDVNVKGMLYCFKHLLPITAEGGSIVNNASILGTRGLPGFSVYAASKGAVISLTASIALEVVAKNIRVNCVSPGPIDTDMLKLASGGDSSNSAGIVPMKRVGTSSEVTSVVLWLFGSGSSYITGQVLNIDGGYTAT
jgi:NAD(P)-dependent dehydrogenase (short-subunit alcohol dehydrogenase family)